MTRRQSTAYDCLVLTSSNTKLQQAGANRYMFNPNKFSKRAKLFNVIQLSHPIDGWTDWPSSSKHQRLAQHAPGPAYSQACSRPAATQRAPSDRSLASVTSIMNLYQPFMNHYSTFIDHYQLSTVIIFYQEDVQLMSQDGHQ